MAADASPEAGFIPSPENHRAFRNALGAFTTGVTIVTTPTPEGLVGITANSFASLSMDPPLVLWSPAKSSSRFGHFERAERFTIHILEAHQAALASHFTRAHQLPEGEEAALEAALARFECSRYAAHEGGDHVILVGRVERVWHRPGAPLAFHAGRFGAFTES